MSGYLTAPVTAGLALGIAFVVLFAGLSAQMPPVSKNGDFLSMQEPIPISPVTDTSTDVQKPSQTSDSTDKPYAMVNVNKSKEIVISNSGWGMWLRHVKTLMTINNIAVYYNDNRLQEKLPDLFERKNTDFFALIINYTMENLDDKEYYAMVHAVAVDQDGKHYQQDVYPGDMGAPLLPGESRSSWFPLQIPQDADDVTLEIHDAQTGRILWTIPLDMQPYGLKPSKISKEHDFRELPDDFALVYSSGIGHDITLDTKQGKVIVKTCDDPPLQNITLSLSKEQLRSIWQTVWDNDFFNLPDFTEECPNPFYCTGMMPESTAELKVTAYNQTHIVDSRQSYEMNLGGFNSDFAKYKEIRAKLDDIVSKVELPQSGCAYL